MIQLYSKKQSEFKMKPKKETIEFLVNFSKSLTIIKTNSKLNIDFNLN